MSSSRPPWKVLVVGDAMADDYVYVTSSRRAQEADVPVWDEVSHERRFGGALNVLNNVVVIGDGEVNGYFWGVNNGTQSIEPVMVKRRYVLDGKIVGRLDNFKSYHQDEITRLFRQMEIAMKDDIKFDAVIVSDYDKGTVTPELISLIETIPVRFVDSKRRDLSMFRGFGVLKLNEEEYGTQASNRNYGVTFEALFEHVVVTKGARGAELRQYDRKQSDRRYVVHSEEFPVTSQKVVDVTGCGDTHTAAMLFSYLKTRDIRRAVKFANACASKKVRMFGTGAPAMEHERDARAEGET